MAIIRRLLRIIEEREALLDKYSPDKLTDVKALLSHTPTPDTGPGPNRPSTEGSHTNGHGGQQVR